MAPNTLLRAGVVTLLAGIFLFWGITVWIHSLEPYPWSNSEVAPVLFWFCISLAGSGGWLLLRAGRSLLLPQWEAGSGMSIFPGAILRKFLSWPQHRAMPLITQLPNFGLIYGAVLWILIFLFMIVSQPYHHRGLMIEFGTRNSVAWKKSPWQETLGVYLTAARKYYVNGQPVPREALRERLQEELSHRMVWRVYFEADYDALNMDAIYAMNAIQEAGGKVAWITPKIREQLEQEKQSAEHAVRQGNP